ncbi:MAG: 3-ketoacyl-ACP reductase [Bacteroidales bacterium]
MKTAIITGASRGIGLACAKSLAIKGYRVVGISRNIEPADPFALAIKADIADLESHAGIINQIMSTFGRIDLLVNNAGVAPINRIDVLEAGVESFDRLMNINLRGPHFLTRDVVNVMLKNQPADGNKGTVIFITSVSAVASSPERAEYCISKAGLSMSAQVYADRLAGQGIAVYEIRPGVIFTDMTAVVKEKYDSRIASGLIPEGRWGQPGDIARAVTVLATGQIPYATGAVVEISGGMNIRHL